MNQNTKRLVLLNLPYVLMGLYATNLGYAWRLAVGADFSEKMMSLMGVLPGALGRIVPSFHPLDLAVGLCCGVGLRFLLRLPVWELSKHHQPMRFSLRSSFGSGNGDLKSNSGCQPVCPGKRGGICGRSPERLG